MPSKMCAHPGFRLNIHYKHIYKEVPSQTLEIKFYLKLTTLELLEYCWKHHAGAEYLGNHNLPHYFYLVFNCIESYYINSYGLEYLN